MCYADKVIQVAKSQIGYLEKASNSQLDEFEANAGKGNYTKYARDYKNFSGENLQAQAWCDMFIDWCFVQAYGTEKAKQLLGGFSAYTPTSAQYFKNRGQWHTSDPKPGDVVFFRNSERINHTGIITAVDGGQVHTVEGNTSATQDVVSNGGGVWAKSYSLGNSRIAGYGRPEYAEKKGEWDGVDTTQFVKDLYVQLLGREADEDGLKTWINEINNGKSFLDIYEGFANSTEGRRRFVREQYHHLLGREGKDNEVQFWVDQLASGKSHEEVYLGFINSPEYQRNHS